VDEFCEHEDGEGEVVKAGRPVAGLGRDDFTRLDNGQFQEIAGIRSVSNPHDRADSPIAVLLLIDALDLPWGFAAFVKSCRVQGFSVCVAGKQGPLSGSRGAWERGLVDSVQH
jgi:hypothetical protein